MSIKAATPFSILRARTNWISKRFSAAPIELKAFSIFAAAITIIHIGLIFRISRELLSWYGKEFGIVTGAGYIGALIFVFFLICHTKGSKPFILRIAIISQLIFTMGIMGLHPLGSIDDGGKFTNYDYWELIWSFIIPIFWILVIMFSPRVSKFCKNILLFQKAY